MRLPANQSVDVEATFTNANGRPVEVQGGVTWVSDNTSVAKVQADAEDDTMATVTAGPSAGKANITAKADADLGEGVRAVEAKLEVEVIAKGEAVGGEITPIGISGDPDRPDNALPGGSGGRPDNALPGRERPTDPGYGQSAPGRPDNSLPGSQPGADNTLPGGQPNRPDQGLPPGAKPK